MKKLSIFLLAIITMNVADAQWTIQDSGITDNLLSVFFTDVNTGYAVGNDFFDSPIIIKTTNGGTTWVNLNYSTSFNEPFYSVYFTSVDTGYVVGRGYSGYNIKKTTDGGINFVYQNSNIDGDLNAVYFPNSRVGFIVGNDGTILQTTDGGAHWIDGTSGTSKHLNSVYFTDVITGYAVGDSGTILKTINSGNSWTIQSSGISSRLFSVDFTDSNTGYAVGENGMILKTVNGGANWFSQNSGSLTTLNSVYFTGIDTGYVVGGYGFGYGTILKTTNGGLYWGRQTSDTTIHLLSVNFPHADTGYAVGFNGTILKTTNGGGYFVGHNELINKSDKLNIYPNPSSTLITIEVSAMPINSQLTITNLNGQELITRQISEPKTVIDISTLPSGVYFVRLTNDKTVEVGKIIKQ